MSSDHLPSSEKPYHAQSLVRQFLIEYQQQLTEALSELDGSGSFIEDQWQREHLGQGRTRVIKQGRLFEQGGVNFSEVHGSQLPASLLQQRPQCKDQPFWAAGVSLILHPLNPHCPTVHLNYRYFESGDLWWFGGGCDLTPYYAYLEDCQHWHQTIKQSMDQFDPNYYPAFKFWCDEYFFNHHRNETRGIGGSFYDYQNGQSGPLIQSDSALQSADKNHPAFSLTQNTKSWDTLFAFHKSNANSFLPAYLPIIERRQHMTWNEQQREFQLYRRGRYVEFNLLHDRGTLFGIQSKGRTESILMSLPPLARWEYNYSPPNNSKEQALTDRFLQRGIDWHHLDLN